MDDSFVMTFIPQKVREEISPRNPLAYQTPSRVQGLFDICPAGTGGTATETFYSTRPGYPAFRLVRSAGYPELYEQSKFAVLMSQVRAGFGRTLTRLPVVFGVSRQTLYNWLDGDEPKPQHQQKLYELANAARKFQELRFKPTTEALGRSLVRGQSFLTLISQGESGEECAQRLVRIVRHGDESRKRLDAIIGGRPRERPSSDDFGPASLDEDN